MIKTEIIEALVPLKDPALIAMLAHFAEIHHYKKGEHIYDVGDMQKKIYILWSGILRCYFIDELQTDITDCFMSDRFMAVNTADFFVEGNRVPSFVAMEALTDMRVLEIDADPLFSMLRRYPQLAGVYVNCLQNALNFQNEINYKRLYLPGKERYAWFREKWPEVDRIASNRQIATFLGIRSEYLSRLRHPKKK